MRVSFNGKTHKVPVKPGEQGQKEFAGAIRKLLNLPEDQEFDVSVLLFCLRAAPAMMLQRVALVVTDSASSVDACRSSSTAARLDLVS